MSGPAVATSSIPLQLRAFAGPGLLALAVAAAVALVLHLAVPVALLGPLGPAVPLVAVAAGAVVLAYGPIRRQERGKAIDASIHFFITHMGVLGTSNIPRSEIFRILGEKREYGPIAGEARRVHKLVKRWNASLADAARFVGGRTPSRTFADFLARFAHALDSGESLTRFLGIEQSTVMDDYANAYRRKLYGIEVFKAVYNSLVMSIAFLFIFAMLLPVLTGTPGPLVLGSVLAVVVLIEALIVLLAVTRAPGDPLWHSAPGSRGAVRAAAPALALSLLGSLVALAVVLATGAPLFVSVAAVVLPLGIVGWRVAALERTIERRELNYPAFVRSLGASTAAHGGQVKVVLKKLRYHDFGPLREDVERLHRRLSLRADDERSWQAFGAETCSRLVFRFSRMFQEGIFVGGKADSIGQLMSDNFIRLVSLRKERNQAAVSFRGLALGLSLALAASLAVGAGVVRVLAASLSSLDLPPEAGSFLGTLGAPLDDRVLDLSIVAIVVVHALASSLVVTLLRGSHLLRAAGDFAIFTAASMGALLVAAPMFGSLSP